MTFSAIEGPLTVNRGNDKNFYFLKNFERHYYKIQLLCRLLFSEDVFLICLENLKILVMLFDYFFFQGVGPNIF